MPRISASQSPLFTTDVVRDLRAAKVTSVLDFIARDAEFLTLKTGISYKDVLYLKRLLSAQFSSPALNGKELYDDVLQSVAVLPSGCSSIDELIDGGLYTMEVMEVVGTVATGKSQFCLQMALETAKGGGRVVFIDTGANFDIVRCHTMLDSQGHTEKEMEKHLSCIIHLQAFTAADVLNKLKSIKGLLETSTRAEPIRLLIIDNITSVIAPILGGASLEGHSFMSLIAKEIKVIATDLALSVLIVNNMVSGANHNLKPALGKAWLEVPDARIEFKRQSDMAISPYGAIKPTTNIERTATLTKSNKMVIGKSRLFKITDKGIENTI